ncbi:hypothetical protein LX32DRAFT_35470 [Colletotrichum zoysiae]|uniref:Uncharacterized protein n=1 Tax=Colletotrichum zoysiae TaxID=1216348 RepID=A0AAD9HC26_9PEZI|nr:hypothetical protein LX32DRAFT_35470 [Colletotrichum zoysiae]
MSYQPLSTAETRAQIHLCRPDNQICVLCDGIQETPGALTAVAHRFVLVLAHQPRSDSITSDAVLLPHPKHLPDESKRMKLYAARPYTE